MAALEAQKRQVPALPEAGEIIGLWDWDVTASLNHLDPGACSASIHKRPVTAAHSRPICRRFIRMTFRR